MTPAEVLDLSGERDLQLAAREEAWRDGYAAGAAGEYDRGYAEAVAVVKAAQHAIAGYLLRAAEVEARRWELRGEARTRATFSQPHKDDYPGQDGAA